MNSHRQSMFNDTAPAPRVPSRPAPPPPSTGADRKPRKDVDSKRAGRSLSKILPGIMMRKPMGSSGVQMPPPTSSIKKSAPPPRPPPPKIQPKKQIVDLLSGSPPSSPSPTLRSQESGFEEDPELWRGWSDSSRSTPLMDWPSEGSTPLTDWPVELSEPPGLPWMPNGASAVSAAFTPGFSTMSAATMPSSAPAPSHTLVQSTAMPTIIRPGPNKKSARSKQDDEDHSPPMPNFPPPPPPPDLDDNLPIPEEVPEEMIDIVKPQTWRAMAAYDFPASCPGDLALKAGDEVEVISQIDENWYIGRIGDFSGQFPGCFVIAIE